MRVQNERTGLFDDIVALMFSLSTTKEQYASVYVIYAPVNVHQ